jgi:cellulose synthase/poly-beta-1,6-N-acetylglucosamine synthase-like glycosyltransferase
VINNLAIILAVLPVAVGLCAYVGYPITLWILGAFRRGTGLPESDPDVWPSVSVSLPAYNEEASIADTLDSLLALEYPQDRLHVLVMSDASTDRTDQIVAGYADRGVELIRLAERGGKTAAENAAAAHLRGEIILNTDATIRILPDSLKPLIRAFQDPTVGLASGRDLSVARADTGASSAEAGYVGYEMWVRDLETRMGTIVGASGCFYAIRHALYESLFPEALSRDFASALISCEHDFRSVSVSEAVCLVPRSRDLSSEFRRKTRTMARGLDTLWYKRSLLNPFKYGWFSLMLINHKLFRWLVYPLIPLAVVGLVILSFSSPVARILLGAGAAAVGLGLLAIRWKSDRPVPKLLSFFGYALITTVAGMAAWVERLRGEKTPTWEPTRRQA